MDNLFKPGRSCTGPEHYSESERLIGMSWEDNRDPENVVNLIARAQVHATLAAAAAAGTYGVAEETRTANDANAWEHAAGEYTAQKRRTGQDG